MNGQPTQRSAPWHQTALPSPECRRRIYLPAIMVLLATLLFLSASRAERTLDLMNSAQQIAFLKEQWESAHKDQDTKRELKVLGELTNTAFFARDFRTAAQAAEAQVAILQQLNQLQEQAKALQFLTSIYKEQKEYQQEIDVCARWLKVAQAANDKAQAASALDAMGIAYRNLGDYPKSIAAFEQALSFAAGNLNEQENAYAGLRWAYDKSGNFDKAAEYAERALAVARERAKHDPYPNTMGESDALYQLGTAYFRQKKYQQAIEAVTKSIELLPKGDDAFSKMGRMASGERREDLGFMLFRNGQLAEAEKAVLAAIDDYDTARTARAAAFEKLERSGKPPNERQNVEEYEFGIDAPRLLEQILVAQKRTDEALEWAEKGRARAFVARLGARTKSPIASPTVAQFRQTARAHNSTLVEYSVIYDGARHERTRFGWLDPAPTGLLIWVIKPTGAIAFRSVDLRPQFTGEHTLSEFVRNARESLGAGEAQADGAPMRQLHDILIAPISDLLPDEAAARVTFVPQDALFLVPFPALRDRSDKYLIERHTITTAPAIQVLDFTHELTTQHRDAAGAVVVGNPKMPSYAEALGEPSQPLQPLDRSEAEAKAVARLLKTDPLIGAEATRATIWPRLPKVRTIHLATHGILDDGSGLRSAIALAPSNDDDGFLTAEEILDLKLNADLVVLSACDTGRGRITGDGVVGLSRSFIAAGVPSVIVSLWTINDASTASLMVAFYQTFQESHDKAAALRQAMLTTKSQYPQPEDWAAFELIGEP
jgi:CHAT domain-containing protein/tetratricopeptide (TPR) repeat protein